MTKKIFGVFAAVMISASLLTVGCNSDVDNSAETPEDTTFNPDNKPNDDTNETPPDDVPPPPPNQ